MENISIMIKAGKKYLYRGKEIVILGYDYVAKELELIPNIEFISNILTSKELKDYIYYYNALAYDIENDCFGYFCTQDYARLEELEDIEDFDVYVTKLKMLRRDIFQIVHLQSQEYMDKEFNDSLTDTSCELLELHKKKEFVKKIIKRAYQRNDLKTRCGEIKVKDGFYVLNAGTEKSISLPATKENYYLLYALGMTDKQFRGYFKDIHDL